MIRRSFLGQEPKRMLSDHKPDPYRKLRRKPVAAAMIDRLVHHAEVIVLKGESYRLRGKGKEVIGPSEGS